ncbi:MAG: uroporphyrinogen decarboxylase family protein [Clostridia bacterium]|nr:uroporphyrinogen decarboxylase family protein [Clostridia bacterium]
MSKQRALRAMNLEETDRVPCQEWIDHPGFIKKTTGIDPFEYPTEAVVAVLKALDIDWYVGIPEKSRKFDEGETSKTEDGVKYTEWGFTGSQWEEEHVFEDEEDVLSYNPFEDSAGRVRIATEKYRRDRINDCLKGQPLVGDSTLVTGLYYTTLFQCFILAFGWELFLVTARLEPKRFARTIDLFTEFSIRNVKEWLKEDIEVMFCHDDLSLSRGLVFPKEWYDKYIFPNYEKIFDPIKKAGKKLIFVSDGNYTQLIDDLFAVGVDGLIVDNYVELEPVMRKYGKDKVICGNVDSRILTEGSIENVKNEVRRCMDIGKKYPGYFIRAAGDLPHNIPLENIECYFESCREMGRR